MVEDLYEHTRSLDALDTKLDKDKTRRRLLSSATQIKERSIVLLVSPLLGKCVSEFKQALPSSAHLIGFCANTLHSEEYQRHAHLRTALPIPLYFQHTIHEAISDIVHTHYVLDCKIIYYSPESYQYREEATKLQDFTISEIKYAWVNINTEKTFASRWFKNMWKNILSAEATQIPHFNTIDRNTLKVSVLIGAGPSLNTQILEMIHRYRSKLILYCVDTALPILQQYNIIPDVCVLLESQYYNIEDLIPKPPRDTIAICDLSSYPQTTRSFLKSHSVCTKFSNISFFERHNDALPLLVPPLGSVGLLAFYLAILSKPHYIFIAGLDFSFYMGLSHGTHSPAYKHWIRTQQRIMPWNTANAHFQSNEIKPVDSQDHTSIRVHSSLLELYKNKLSQILIPLAGTYNIECLDLNSESYIDNIRNSGIKEADCILKSTQDIRFEWKHIFTAPHADKKNKWKAHTTTQDSRNTAIHILNEEAGICLSSMKLLKTLYASKALPTQADWSQGLDTYSIILGEDPFRLKTDLEYWMDKNIHTRFFIVLQHMYSEIQQALSILH